MPQPVDWLGGKQFSCSGLLGGFCEVFLQLRRLLVLAALEREDAVQQKQEVRRRLKNDRDCTK